MTIDNLSRRKAIATLGIGAAAMTINEASAQTPAAAPSAGMGIFCFTAPLFRSMTRNSAASLDRIELLGGTCPEADRPTSHRVVARKCNKERRRTRERVGKSVKNKSDTHKGAILHDRGLLSRGHFRHCRMKALHLMIGTVRHDGVLVRLVEVIL